MIVPMSVIQNRTAVFDVRTICEVVMFLIKVSCISSTLVIDLIGQLTRVVWSSVSKAMILLASKTK